MFIYRQPYLINQNSNGFSKLQYIQKINLYLLATHTLTHKRYTHARTHNTNYNKRKNLFIGRNYILDIY